MTYWTRDVPNTEFESVDQLLAASKDWAHGDYLVWVTGEQRARKAGYLEVSAEGTRWHPRDATYAYVPPVYTPAQNPPRVFGMYNPVSESEGRWTLRAKGRMTMGTGSFIKGRALREDYHIESTCRSSDGPIQREWTVMRRGSARLRITVETGRVGGPELLIEHWTEE